MCPDRTLRRANSTQQLTSGRSAGPALKRLRQRFTSGVTAVADRFCQCIVRRGNGRAASLLACEAACS